LIAWAEQSPVPIPLGTVRVTSWMPVKLVRPYPEALHEPMKVTVANGSRKHSATSVKTDDECQRWMRDVRVIDRP
jgi:hypothetical protein